MKNLLIIFALLPTFLFAQDQRLLGLERDTVLNDSGFYSIVYRLVDTIGEYETGNYYVKVTVLDSSQMVKELYSSAKGYYDRIGEFEGMRLSALRQAAQLRKKAKELSQVDEYRQYVMPIVRESMAGTYAIRYGQNIHRIDLQANGVARDAEGTLIMTHAPMSTTWTTVVYRVGEQENIQCYQIRPGVWLGDGAQGRLIMRKI